MYPQETEYLMYSTSDVLRSSRVSNRWQCRHPYIWHLIFPFMIISVSSDIPVQAFETIEREKKKSTV